MSLPMERGWNEVDFRISSLSPDFLHVPTPQFNGFLVLKNRETEAAAEKMGFPLDFVPAVSALSVFLE